MQLLFFPGLHRCGSTWVTHWLNEHSEVHVEPENYTFFNAASQENDPSIIKQICEDYFGQRNPLAKPIFADKSPRGITLRGQHVAKVIHSAFPQAKVIIFYKFLPDYIFSLMHLPEWGRNRNFKDAFDDCMLNAPHIEAYQDERILYLRYEDLISTPRICAERIVEFLDIPLHQPLIPWNNPLNTIHSSYNSERWRELMKEHSDELSLLNPHLRRLNYPECS